MNRNSSNTGLVLNSYKVDTASLHNSIKQLNSMKEELESTISQYRLNESTFLQENQRLKDEINILQKKLNDKPINHDKWKQKNPSLQEELKKQKFEKIKFKEMYEVERKNHQELRDFYERKLEIWQRDHHLLVNKYQQRIIQLMSEINQIKGMSSSQVEKSRKSFNSKKDNSGENPCSSSSNIESLHGSHKKFTSRVSMDLPLTGGFQKNGSPQTPYWRIQEEPDEQIFQATIRKLYYCIKQMGITSRQSLMLPQMRKMKSIKAPTRKEILNFMRNPPIQERDRIKIQKNINLLDIEVYKKYGRVTGENLVDFILERVEEYEAAEKINSEDISVSGITPSLHRASSYGLSSVSHSKNDPRNSSQKKSMNRPNITDALKIQSDGSFIK